MTQELGLAAKQSRSNKIKYTSLFNHLGTEVLNSNYKAIYILCSEYWLG